MSKRVYIPKPKKEQVVKIKEKSIEINIEIKEEEVPVILKEIQISPMTSVDFCRQFNLNESNKTIIERKYATKIYTENQWKLILIKENIVI